MQSTTGILSPSGMTENLLHKVLLIIPAHQYCAILNLLQQFGTRLLGGKDAANPRSLLIYLCLDLRNVVKVTGTVFNIHVIHYLHWPLCIQ